MVHPKCWTRTSLSLTASISAQQSWQGSYGETKSVSYCLFKIHLFSLCLWNSVDLWVEDSFHKVMRGPCKDSDMLKELQLFDQWFCFLLESWMHQLDKFFWFQFCFTMFSILYSPSCLAILWPSHDIWMDGEGKLFNLRDFLISILNLVNFTCI